MDISTKFLSLTFENPFVLASAPPTGSYEKIARAFDTGWSGAVIKTLMEEPVKNLKNRFASIKNGGSVSCFENLEQVSEKNSEEWFLDIRKLKENYPEKVIIGSIMGDAERYDNWKKLAMGCQHAGADIIELNFSCPNGYPDRGTGAALGQNPDTCREIVGWLKNDKDIKIPVIAKLSAAVSDITSVGKAVSDGGGDGICAINTFPAFMGFDLMSLNPKANINGYSTYGGYSGPGIKPIALKSVSALLKKPGLPVIACGGIVTGFDAAEFLLLGSPVVQLATAVMFEGIKIIRKLENELKEFMSWHGFLKIEDFLGIGNKKICCYDDLDIDYDVKAVINGEKCVGCGRCVISCRDGGYQAIDMFDKKAVVDTAKCRGCSLCLNVCPNDAVEMIQVNEI